MGEKLHHCCNTCVYRYENGTWLNYCSKQKVCYNGFSAYSPNAEMKKQEQEEGKKIK